MKKGLLVTIALTLFFTLGFGQYADAKPRGGGGIKSPKQSITTPKKSDGATQSNPGTKAPTNKAGTTKPGFFSGGSLMKGLMVGGLAGLLFGSLFSGLGALGNILGFMVNMLAIFALIMIIRVAFVYLRSKRNPPNQRRPY